MAWNWSHTIEAYQNARTNLERLPLPTLQVIYAEIRASNWGSPRFDFVSPDHNSRKYLDALRYAAEKLSAVCGETTNEMLIDFIWQFAEEYATCDNGGFNAWLCPSGCHTVPFDLEDLENEDNE